MDSHKLKIILSHLTGQGQHGAQESLSQKDGVRRQTFLLMFVRKSMLESATDKYSGTEGGTSHTRLLFSDSSQDSCSNQGWVQLPLG